MRGDFVVFVVRQISFSVCSLTAFAYLEKLQWRTTSVFRLGELGLLLNRDKYRSFRASNTKMTHSKRHSRPLPVKMTKKKKLEHVIFHKRLGEEQIDVYKFATSNMRGTVVEWIPDFVPSCFMFVRWHDLLDLTVSPSLDDVDGGGWGILYFRTG